MRHGLARSSVVLALALTITLLAGAAVPGVGAKELPRRFKMLAWVNDARQDRSLRQLEMGWKLTKLARQHSRAMADKDSLYHSSNLSSKLGFASWSTWGENVGVGVDPGGLYRAFMKSEPHRKNMLNSRFKRVGVGFIRDEDGILWVTMIFYG